MADVELRSKAHMAPVAAFADAQVAPAFRLPEEHDEGASCAGVEPARQRQKDFPAEVDRSPSFRGAGDGEGDNRPPHFEEDISSGHRQKKHVHFASVEISEIWVADSALDYNRRSLVVDLSKTPFALFRRDAVMMKQARALSGSAPLPPPGPPALPRALQAVHPRPSAAQISEGSCNSDDSSPASSPPPSSAGRSSSSSARAWEAESSESSEGHTDLETDDTETETDWQSDAESSGWSSSECSPQPCLVGQHIRRGSQQLDSQVQTGPAFYGVWKRVKSENYEELLLSSGVPKRAVAEAMKKHPVHIIDHDGSYFRLIVKNGLSKVDNTFWIGEEPTQDIVGGRSYEVSMNWAHIAGYGSENELALTSICHARGEEVIAIRSLHDGGNGMVLTQIVRRPAENFEVRAKHFFKRVTSKSELGGGAGRQKKKQLSSNVVTVRRKKA